MAPNQLCRLLKLPPSLRASAFTRALRTPAPPTISLCLARHLTTTTVPNAEAKPSFPPPNQSSVSATEVSHFKALASSWWDPQGSSRLLHLMNPLRHKFIRQCTKHDGDGLSGKRRYLDVGCGGGIFAESAARLYNTEAVIGIDPTPEVIAVAQQHQRQDPLLLEKGRLSYRNTAIEDLSLPASPDSAYDIITLFEVIEHIRQPSPFLQSCLKHLKPGGWLIGSTIARTNTSWFTTKLMAEEVLRLVPRGTHDWKQYLQPSELLQWASAQSGLDVDGKGIGSGWRVMGVVYLPGFGWKEVGGSEAWGNYFFGMRKRAEET